MMDLRLTQDERHNRAVVVTASIWAVGVVAIGTTLGLHLAWWIDDLGMMELRLRATGAYMEVPE